VSSRSSNKSQPTFEGLHGVGWVKSAHGLRGEIYIQLFSKTADWQDQAEQLWLLKADESEPQAYEIDRLSPHKEGLIVKLKGFSDRNQSEAVQKAVVYIDADLLVAEPGEAIFLNEILSFEVFDKNENRIGQVVGFGTNGAQDLLRIAREGEKEALVPLIDAFLVRIDFEKHKIFMDLPPGLLDVETT
jgi:16S rRNA processing protein RimM